MLRYLSDEWLTVAAELLEQLTLSIAPVEDFAVVTRVTEVPSAPDGLVEYTYVLTADQVRLELGSREDLSSVRFTQRFRIAESVARGTLSAQSAFMSGDIQLGGDVSALIANSGLVAEIGDALVDLRSQTRFTEPEPL